MKGYYKYWRTDSNKWYWHLKAGNHKIILPSEGYTTEASCLNGIKSMQTSTAVRAPLTIEFSKGNRWLYFVIKANNGEPLGRSQMYKSRKGARKGHASILRNRSTKKIVRVY